MSDNSKKTNTFEDKDTELDELLDSALKDFSFENKTEDEKKEIEDKMWNYVDELCTKEEEEKKGPQGQLKALLNTNFDFVNEALVKMNQMTLTQELQSDIAQAAKDLSQTSESLQNTSPLLNDEELAEMFGKAGIDEQLANDIVPFMEGMMHSLLSKEVLYPSLKEIVDKYPAWLEEKKESLETKDFDRYTQQLTLMQKVCVELESDSGDDTESLKKDRFWRTFNLMQEIQNCGPPPVELVGEQPPPFPLDSDGNPTLPPGFEQNCSVM